MHDNPEYAPRRDEDLVLLAQKGDSASFTELMKRYRSIGLKLAVTVLRDVGDAEDEVQNASWKAFHHMASFNHESRFSTWFSRIVLNQCLMRLRQHRRRRLVYLEDTRAGEEASRIDLPSSRATPETEVGTNEVAALLAREVRRMPPLLRDVFVLREMEERPMPYVAQALGITIPAAKSRLLRARLELKRKLERHCGRNGLATLTA